MGIEMSQNELGVVSDQLGQADFYPDALRGHQPKGLVGIEQVSAYQLQQQVSTEGQLVDEGVDVRGHR